MYSTFEKGTATTTNYRMFFRDGDGKIISPFHDIPLYASNKAGATLAFAGPVIYNMVVEIPRWSHAKMEIATTELMNPIKQDIKKDKLRYVHNVYPYHGYIWNYGALPQTWENPGHRDPNTYAFGDNDPVDVCEIGTKILKRGQVVQVKVLGILALVDNDECDWKVIAIKADDPMACKLNDIADVEVHMPGVISSTIEWLRIYKIPDGKPANKFGFEGKPKGSVAARNIIQFLHEEWERLIRPGRHHEIAIENTSVDESRARITHEEAEEEVNKLPPFSPGKGLSEEERDELDKVSFATRPVETYDF